MDKANIQTILPLSGPQQAILLHAFQDVEGDSGLIQVKFHIEGDIDDGLMEQAWQDVILRHDALRAGVHIPKSQKPMMVVLKSAPVTVNLRDIRAEERETQEQIIKDWVAQDAVDPLAINASPVSRVMCFRRGDLSRDYIWTTQKILVDGWSAIVVLGDLLERYRARREGGSDALAPAPKLQSYFTYLKSLNEDASEAFWSEHFEGFQNTGSVFRAASDGTDASGSIPLEPGVWRRLESASSKLGVTPSAFVSAAWAVFLSLAGAGDDVAFALSLSGRAFDMDGHDTHVGPFATTAPRRARLPADATFDQVAKEMNAANLRAQAHETLSPHKIFGGTQVTRHVPMPDTLLTVEALPDSDFHIDTDGGVSLTGFSSGVSSGFPVTLVVLPGETGELHYSFHDLADPDRATHLLPHFARLLSDVAGEPDVTLKMLRERYADLAQNTERHAHLTVVTPPRTAMELAIAEIWKGVLGLTEIDMSRDFVSHGGRSFAAIQILTRIEETFGKRVPLVDFIQAQTVPALADLVTREVSADVHWQTLVPFRTAGTKTPLLFVHLGQHPVTFLKPFFERLDPDQPFFAVQPVGVSGDGKPLETFEALAKVHIDEYLSLAEQGPVHVIGHCGGARLAVEMIRQLEDRGCPVETFIAIDTRPPIAKGRADVQTATQSAGSLAPAPYTANRIAKAVLRRTKRTLKTSWGSLTGNDELTREVRGELVERACYLADGAYRATQFPDQVTVLHSHDSPDRSFDWDPVVNKVDHQTLQVGHYTMFFEPDVDILKEEITRRIYQEI